MHPLFHDDLLYPCVAGSLDLSSKPALQIFIRSNIRQTCTWINQKVDELCKKVFKNIYPGIQDVPKEFLYRWILGKPEIKPIESIFTENAQSISYNGMSIVACNNVLQCGHLSIEIPKLTFMHRLGDYLILQYDETVGAFSLEEWIRTGDPVYKKLEDLKGAMLIKAFNDQLLFYKPKSRFCMLYVDNMQLKMNECLTLGSDLIRISIADSFQHVFHQKSQCTIFFCLQLSFHPLLGAVFTDELTPSETQEIVLHDAEKVHAGRLIAFKDTVLFCSLDKDHHLQMHRIDPKNNCIYMRPLELAGKPKISFNNLISAEIQLDKIFLIANSFDGYNWTDLHSYLIVIDMATQSVELAREIGVTPYQKINIISSSLGALVITSSKADNAYSVDYT